MASGHKVEGRRRGVKYLRPKQARGPSENGWLACFLSTLSGSSHLSGRNSSGEWKFSSECVAAYEDVKTSVYTNFFQCVCPIEGEAARPTPSGINTPPTVSPGLILGMPTGTDGNILKPSSMTAFRYGNRSVVWPVISS